MLQNEFLSQRRGVATLARTEVAQIDRLEPSPNVIWKQPDSGIILDWSLIEFPSLFNHLFDVIRITFQSIVQTKIFFKISETETLPNLLYDIFAVWMHENIKK